MNACGHEIQDKIKKFPAKAPFDLMMETLESVIDDKKKYKSDLDTFDSLKLKWFRNVDNPKRAEFTDKKPEIKQYKYAKLFSQYQLDEIVNKKNDLKKIKIHFMLHKAESIEDISKGLEKIYQLAKEKSDREQEEREEKFNQGMKTFFKHEQEEDETPVMPNANPNIQILSETRKDNAIIPSRMGEDTINRIKEWRIGVYNSAPDKDDPVVNSQNDNSTNEVVKDNLVHDAVSPAEELKSNGGKNEVEKDNLVHDAVSSAEELKSNGRKNEVEKDNQFVEWLLNFDKVIFKVLKEMSNLSFVAYFLQHIFKQENPTPSQQQAATSADDKQGISSTNPRDVNKETATSDTQNPYLHGISQDTKASTNQNTASDADEDKSPHP